MNFYVGITQHDFAACSLVSRNVSENCFDITILITVLHNLFIFFHRDSLQKQCVDNFQHFSLVIDGIFPPGVITSWSVKIKTTCYHTRNRTKNSSNRLFPFFIVLQLMDFARTPLRKRHDKRKYNDVIFSVSNSFFSPKSNCQYYAEVMIEINGGKQRTHIYYGYMYTSVLRMYYGVRFDNTRVCGIRYNHRLGEYTLHTLSGNK